MKIIALSGYAGSGKDTVGEYLVHRYNYFRIAMADALKTKVNSEFSIPPGYPKDLELPGSSQTPRDLYIKVGNFYRSIDTDFWIKQLYFHPDTRYVITDLRFRSELLYLSNKFGYQVLTIRVDRFSESRIDDISEKDLDGVTMDYTLPNRGTIKELYKSIDQIMEGLGV